MLFHPLPFTMVFSGMWKYEWGRAWVEQVNTAHGWPDGLVEIGSLKHIWRCLVTVSSRVPNLSQAVHFFYDRMRVTFRQILGRQNPAAPGWSRTRLVSHGLDNGLAMMCLLALQIFCPNRSSFQVFLTDQSSKWDPIKIRMMIFFLLSWTWVWLKNKDWQDKDEWLHLTIWDIFGDRSSVRLKLPQFHGWKPHVRQMTDQIQIFHV